jgi:hypothetical protein
MNNLYAEILDIALLNSKARSADEYKKLFNNNLFSDPEQWGQIKLTDEIPGLMDGITSRMKYSMSKMSLGIYNVLDAGPHRNISKTDEIFLFSGFTEIETVNKIGKLIMEENFIINPALFPNSVHHVALSYYTILKKISNYTVAINEGLNTNYSFINFVSERVRIPGDFIIATGEESSNFFSYDIKRTLEIVPSYAAYKIKPGQNRGFKYLGDFDQLALILKTEQFERASDIFCDKATFRELQQKNIKKTIYSEYPIMMDNPCGFIARLAMPFYFNFQGVSLVIEQIKNNYFVFEVVL